MEEIEREEWAFRLSQPSPVSAPLTRLQHLLTTAALETGRAACVVPCDRLSNTNKAVRRLRRILHVLTKSQCQKAVSYSWCAFGIENTPSESKIQGTVIEIRCPSFRASTTKTLGEVCNY